MWHYCGWYWSCIRSWRISFCCIVPVYTTMWLAISKSDWYNLKIVIDCQDNVMCFIYNISARLWRYWRQCHSNIVTISECPLGNRKQRLSFSSCYGKGNVLLLVGQSQSVSSCANLKYFFDSKSKYLHLPPQKKIYIAITYFTRNQQNFISNWDAKYLWIKVLLVPQVWQNLFGSLLHGKTAEIETPQDGFH